MLSNSTRFISKNGNRIPSFENITNFFQYLRNAIFSAGLMFLHETHSTIHDEKKWNNEFQRKLFFLLGQSNSFRVAIGSIGNMSFEISSRN